jgi:hypothetical protein
MIGKYTRLTCCNNEQELIVKNPRPMNNCCSTSRTKYDYVPMTESIRARAALCIGYVRPGLPSSDCTPFVSSGGATSTINTETTTSNGPVNLLGSTQNPGQNPVQVRTRPASETTALAGIITLNAATDESNPDTRFSMYFPETPPPPLSKICPERIPNPAPPTRDRFCFQGSLFAPSVPGGPIA